MNDEQLLRYSRHILLDGFDIEAQEKLLASTVCILGAGGLGCPAALYLAASGVGHIILVDDDQVELSNLQRQIAHGTADIADAKTASLKRSLQAINPDIQITAIKQRITLESNTEIFQQADVVLDCSDNFTIRFLLNRLCWQYKKPLVSGAAIRTQGQLAVFDFRQDDSPCYACLYSEEATAGESCSENGVLSPLVGIIGSWQAAEAIKLLTGFGQPLQAYLQAIDIHNNKIQQWRISKDKHCPVCQKHA